MGGIVTENTVDNQKVTGVSIILWTFPWVLGIYCDKNQKNKTGHAKKTTTLLLMQLTHFWLCLSSTISTKLQQQ